ncbi:MAG: hypothetical protein JWN39_2644, partial [Ilumatobacteraceae bacterium]|nr:hypothetical protein [Ilumatobacteraceae bacterium]
EGDQWIDVVKKGQGVLNVLAVATVKAEVDQQLHTLSDADTVVHAAV